jgi:hypothetical protein
MVYAIVLVIVAKLFIGNYQAAVPYIRWIGVSVIAIV